MSVVEQGLQAIRESNEFDKDSRNLVDRWQVAGVGEESLGQVIRFMERHPLIDYGTPGALVHFIETFGTASYEVALRESVARSPTFQTIWMLNRIINEDPQHPANADRVKLLQVVAERPDLDPEIRDWAQDFVEMHI